MEAAIPQAWIPGGGRRVLAGHRRGRTSMAFGSSHGPNREDGGSSRGEHHVMPARLDHPTLAVARRSHSEQGGRCGNVATSQTTGRNTKTARNRTVYRYIFLPRTSTFVLVRLAAAAGEKLRRHRAAVKIMAVAAAKVPLMRRGRWDRYVCAVECAFGERANPAPQAQQPPS